MRFSRMCAKLAFRVCWEWAPARMFVQLQQKCHLPVGVLFIRLVKNIINERNRLERLLNSLGGINPWPEIMEDNLRQLGTCNTTSRRSALRISAWTLQLIRCWAR